LLCLSDHFGGFGHTVALAANRTEDRFQAGDPVGLDVHQATSQVLDVRGGVVRDEQR